MSGGSGLGQELKGCRRQWFQNGVKTRNGLPLWFCTVHGSKSKRLLKLSTTHPDCLRTSLRWRSRAMTDGSYRRFQNTARACVSCSRRIIVACVAPERIIRREPRFARAFCRLARDWCSHHREAAPGGHGFSSSGDQMKTGMMGLPRSTAASSAGLSARRRSNRNQTKVGDLAVRFDLRDICLQLIPCPNCCGRSTADIVTHNRRGRGARAVSDSGGWKSGLLGAIPYGRVWITSFHNQDPAVFRRSLETREPSSR